MRIATGTTRIFNGQLIDGTGTEPVRDAVVVVDDGRISYAGPAIGAPQLASDAQQIDAKGGTIMPGLIEPHFHATYYNVLHLEDLDIKYPPEMVALQSTFNSRMALECGYTSARSAGCLFNTDVWLAEAIDTDMVPGPRFVPGGQEICGAGGVMDWNPDFRKIGMEGVIIVVDGADSARSAARRLVKAGAQWLKTYPTGDAAAPDTNDHHTLSMTFEEMNAVSEVAHNHRRKVYGHCRATEGIKNALKAGYDSIEHGTFLDNECIDMMIEGNVPCVPALQFELASVNNGKEFGLLPTGDRWAPGDARSRRDQCPQAPRSGWSVGLGRRLWLRMEPARRLRQGAQLLRRLRRLQPDGHDRVCDPDGSGDLRNRPRRRDAGGRQAGRHPRC